MDGVEDDLCDFGYFHLAKSASELSTHHQFQVGAVIVNKKPVSVGANLAKTHPIFANEENGVYSIHAEVKAVLSCPRSKLRGAEIWVYREKADGTVGMSKPCKNCLAVLAESGIKKVYYSQEPNTYGVMSL